MNPILHNQTKSSIELFLGHPAHAVALVGDSGAGKDFLSGYIAAQLLGVATDKLGHNAYFLEIGTSEAAAGIEEVRKLQNFLSLKVPGDAAIRRCVVIRQIETLGREAQNALLKTLEEPPQDTVIICTVAEAQQLPATIASRVQWLTVAPITIKQAKDSFSSYSLAEIERAYHVSEGNVGLLSALLSEKGDHPMVMAIEEARKLLTDSSYQRMLSVEAITKDRQIDLASLLNALYKLLHAALQAASKNDTRQDITRLSEQIAQVLRAQQLIDSKVQPKVVLSWLFYSL